jgi:hypothetical protein
MARRHALTQIWFLRDKASGRSCEQAQNPAPGRKNHNPYFAARLLISKLTPENHEQFQHYAA